MKKETEWNKPFCNALDKSDEKSLMKCLTFLDFTSELAFLYYQACQALYPILLISISLYCYERLIGCISHVEQMNGQIKRFRKGRKTLLDYYYIY
jgi:hypothetical protein